MAGQSGNRLAPVLTKASSWMSDGRATGFDLAASVDQTEAR
jgi:hypothetical protein